jgi:hypothetical protein
LWQHLTRAPAGNSTSDDSGPSNCSSPASWANLPDDAYSFSVAATDRLGNRAAPVTVRFSVDTVPPLIGNLAFPLATRNNSISVSFTVTDPGSGVNGTQCRCATTRLHLEIKGSKFLRVCCMHESLDVHILT